MLLLFKNISFFFFFFLLNISANQHSKTIFKCFCFWFFWSSQRMLPHVILVSFGRGWGGGEAKSFVLHRNEQRTKLSKNILCPLLKVNLKTQRLFWVLLDRDHHPRDRLVHKGANYPLLSTLFPLMLHVSHINRCPTCAITPYTYGPSPHLAVICVRVSPSILLLP